MRKLSIRFFLALMLIISLAVPALAAETAQLTLDAEHTSVESGDTFSVLVKVKDNPGFQSLQLNVFYDTQILTCTEVKAGKILKQDGVIFAANEAADDKAAFAGINVDPIEGDGTLAELTFRADRAGSVTLTLDVVRMSNDGSQLAVSTDTARINVTAPQEEDTQNGETQEEPQEDTQAKPEVLDISFSDVPESHWAHTYIQNVVRRGLFTGISNTQFGPDGKVTRGMFVTVLYSCAGAPKVDPSTFDDVSPTAWYSKPVAWASQQGIVSGIGGNNFGPETPITREQLALILYQYAGGTSPGTEAFVKMFYPDGKDIHSWALTAMSWAVNEGLLSGRAGNLLAPQDTATRAEVAVIMNNFVNASE